MRLKTFCRVIYLLEVEGLNSKKVQVQQMLLIKAIHLLFQDQVDQGMQHLEDNHLLRIDFLNKDSLLEICIKHRPYFNSHLNKNKLIKLYKDKNN